MEEMYRDAGNRIFLERSVHGYSRERLAEIAGISTKFLYEIEMGKTGFSVWILKKLCDALEVGYSYILTGEGHRE
ncbi:MAG: helix-turn-helix domain-containing protein [Clostridiales bacterium]|nr:helix-turn-helix domain-containing protein [Clostridiales bacterium]